MFLYNPLWKTLIDKNISKADFRKDCNIPKQTFTDMNKNKFVSLKTLNKICSFLNCKIEDVIEFIPDKD